MSGNNEDTEEKRYVPKRYYNSTDIDVALIQKDIKQIFEEVAELKESINTIKDYFVKALIGAGATVGVYFLNWILGGGLNHVINSIGPS